MDGRYEEVQAKPGARDTDSLQKSQLAIAEVLHKLNELRGRGRVERLLKVEVARLALGFAGPLEKLIRCLGSHGQDSRRTMARVVDEAPV